MGTTDTKKRRRLSIKMKLTLLTFLIAIIPCVVIGALAVIKSRIALEKDSIDHLTSIREMKKERIEDYFKTISDQIVTLSENRMIVDAMKEFSDAFSKVEAETGDEFENDKERRLQGLKERYIYQRENTPGSSQDAGSSWFPSGNISQILQTSYISENIKPINHKHELDYNPDNTLYSRLHKRYHPIIRSFQQKFGYYDIFLVEPDKGHIVYTVFKEIDFATSLLTGPHRNTNFARAFAGALEANSNEDVVLVDFEQYEPSYNSPASFIATPIFDGDKKVGVLAFQLPIDKINNIMTSGGQWEKVGLGKTGSTNIIASDFTLRNNTRELIENKENYLRDMELAGADTGMIENIRKSGTTILFQSDKDQGTEAAIGGTTGYGVFTDHSGHDIFSVYAPLNIKGMKWAILAEIDRDEALVASRELTWWVSIIVAIVAAISLAVGFPIIRGIIVSMKIVTDKLYELATDDADLTKRIPVESNDEVGQLSGNFNVVMGKLMALVKQVQQSSIQLSSTSTQIAASSNELEATATEQAASTNQVVATSKEISSTSQELVNTMKEVSNVALETTKLAGYGQKSLTDMENIMRQLLEATESISSKLSVINEKTNNINSVVTTITKIADQTNLLSLNAAIEAEKAGEYGLGFSVVAKEVRRLADQTAVATLDIEQMVKGMQSAVSSGVMEMDKFSKKAVDGFEEITLLSEQMNKIIDLVQVLTPKFESVNQGMQSQSEGAQQISESMVQLDESVHQITTSLRDFNKATERLNDSAQDLRKEVLRFKV